MDDPAVVLKTAHAQLSAQTVPNRFVDRLEAGEVPAERLKVLAGELYRLVGSDRRSFAILASRFPEPPVGDLYLAMAQGESEALRLLLGFARFLDLDESWLHSYEPRPLAQAYPAYLTQTAVAGSRSDAALALLANVAESGRTYTRVADALADRYGCPDSALAHFRYFADTPQELLDQATEVLASGLSRGDDPAAAIRCARLVHAYETMFWDSLIPGN